MTLSQAVAHIEGFGVDPHNRPTRNNNPGDLELRSWMKVPPFNAILEVGVTQPRFAHFPSADIGWSALDHLLLTVYSSYTVQNMVYKFAPPVENNTVDYVRLVCVKANCEPNDIVQEVMSR